MYVCVSVFVLAAYRLNMHRNQSCHFRFMSDFYAIPFTVLHCCVLQRLKLLYAATASSSSSSFGGGHYHRSQQPTMPNNVRTSSVVVESNDNVAQWKNESILILNKTEKLSAQSLPLLHLVDATTTAHNSLQS